MIACGLLIAQTCSGSRAGVHQSVPRGPKEGLDCQGGQKSGFSQVVGKEIGESFIFILWAKIQGKNHQWHSWTQF